MTERATGAIVPDVVLAGTIHTRRMRIDEIDEAIIDLMKERQSLSAGIRRTKKRLNQPEVDLERERDIVSVYVAGLGRPTGYDVANAVLHHSKDVKL